MTIRELIAELGELDINRDVDIFVNDYEGNAVCRSIEKIDSVTSPTVWLETTITKIG